MKLHVFFLFPRTLLKKLKGGSTKNFKGGTKKYNPEKSHPAKKSSILDDWEADEVIPIFQRLLKLRGTNDFVDRTKKDKKITNL